MTSYPANRLAKSASSYLRQHAHDPVDWFPWGEEAFAKALAENKPIFLSIGYATCHWCHVMAEESFRDPEIAQLLNQHFVPVKVDRQELPQVDEAYMRAALALQGQGGWPLSVFCTPAGEPFFAGTYFPPTSRGGLPSFRQVLVTIQALWQSQREEILQAAASLKSLWHSPPPPPASLNLQALEEKALAHLRQEFDSRHGGFFPAPKFPMPARLRFLLQQAQRGNSLARDMLAFTLDAMARGGIRDPIFGGFHRYATDAAWFIPHYEKMLPDNALLATLYLEAGWALGQPHWRQVALETLHFVALLAQGSPGGREKNPPLGPWGEPAFAAGWDADTQGEEGLTFTFTWAELAQSLTPQELHLLQALSPFPWEPSQPRPLALAPPTPSLAQALGLSLGQLQKTLRQLRQKVRRLAQSKGLPAVDTLPVSAWNAMACAAWARYVALSRAGTLPATQEGPGFPPRALPSSPFLRTAESLWQQGWVATGEIPRTLPQGQKGAPETLEDVAWTATAFLALFSATGFSGWYRRALELLTSAVPRYLGEQGELFTTPLGQKVVKATLWAGYDGAQPSPGAVLCEALLQAWLLSGNPAFHRWAQQALAFAASFLASGPQHGCAWLTAARLAEDPWLVVVAGDPLWPSTRALLRTAFRQGPSGQVVAFLDHWPPHPQELEELPVFQDRPAAGPGQAAAYLCAGGQCWPPVTEPGHLLSLLRKARRGPPSGL